MKNVTIPADLLERLIDDGRGSVASDEAQAILDREKSEADQVPFDEILEATHLIHEMYRVKDRLGNGPNRVFENEKTGALVGVAFFRMDDIAGRNDFATIKYGDFEYSFKAETIRLSNYKLMASQFVYQLGLSK